MRMSRLEPFLETSGQWSRLAFELDGRRNAADKVRQHEHSAPQTVRILEKEKRIICIVAKLAVPVGPDLQGRQSGPQQVLANRAVVHGLRALGAAIDEQQPRQGNVPLELGRTIIVGLFWVIMGVFYVLQVAKFVFYLAGLLYLRRTSLDPLFVPRAEAVS